MTQEEKAKAYDEAIEKAKQTLEASSAPEAKMIVYHFFPGLCESEDESIRKEIIDIVTSYRSNCVYEGTHHFDDCLAWLEKQKDLDKMIVVSPEVWDMAISDAFENGKKEGEKQKEQKPKNILTDDDSLQTAYLKGQTDVLEDPEAYGLQKEQKPILEVFGFKVGDAVRLKDGDGRKHIIKSFEEVEGIHGPNFYHVEFEDDSARDGIYPGEEYPNGYYTQMEKFEEEQKPVEKPINWTELTWKDIIELEGIINNVHYEFRNGIGQESFGKEVLEKFREYKGDEYLDEKEQKPVLTAKEAWKEMRLEVYAQASGNRHQPNCSYDFTKMFSLYDIDEIFEKIGNSTVGSQPAEWSEEDEKTINIAIETLEHEGYPVLAERLKSFRSRTKSSNNWKPSEEQMEALDKAIPVCLGVVGRDEIAPLESLYNDLKKLK